ILVFVAAGLSALSGALLVTQHTEANPTARIILVGLIATAFPGLRNPLVAGGIGFLVGLGDFAARYLAPPPLREIAPAVLFISIVIIQAWARPTRVDLDPLVLDRLIKLLGMLGSDHDG